MSSENVLSNSSRKISRQNVSEMENEELSSHIQDLEKTLAVNKQVLSDVIIGKIPNSGPATIIFQLMKEIQDSEENYLKIVKDCEENQAKALMDEQISMEYSMKEQEYIMEFEEKISDFIYQNDKKSKYISEISLNIRQLDEENELYKKSKNMIIIPPTEDIIELHCQVEEIKRVLTLEARHLYSLQLYKEKLLENFETLERANEKNRILMRNPMNRKPGIEHSNSNLKNDTSMEILIDRISDEENEEINIAPMKINLIKPKSQQIFDISLRKQQTLSFDQLNSFSARPQSAKAKYIDEHIESLKGEISQIIKDLVLISKENEIYLENNEKLAKNYLKLHTYIGQSELPEKVPNPINSNINEEVFKFIDSPLEADQKLFNKG